MSAAVALDINPSKYEMIEEKADVGEAPEDPEEGVGSKPRGSSGLELFLFPFVLATAVAVLLPVEVAGVNDIIFWPSPEVFNYEEFNFS